MLTGALAHRFRLIYEDLIHWLQTTIVTSPWLTSCDHFLASWHPEQAEGASQASINRLQSWSPQILHSMIHDNQQISLRALVQILESCTLYTVQPGLGVRDNLCVCVLCPLSQLTVKTIKIHSPSPVCCQEPGVQSIARQQWPDPGPGLHTLTGVTSGQVKTNCERGENTGEAQMWR